MGRWYLLTICSRLDVGTSELSWIVYRLCRRGKYKNVTISSIHWVMKLHANLIKELELRMTNWFGRKKAITNDIFGNVVSESWNINSDPCDGQVKNINNNSKHSWNAYLTSNTSLCFMSIILLTLRGICCYYPTHTA